MHVNEITDGYILSSSLDELEIGSRQSQNMLYLDYYDVQIISSDGPTIYSQRLFHNNGLVSVVDVRSIVENYMQWQGIVCDTFEIYAVAPGIQRSWFLKVLYCREYAPNVSVADFLRKSFLLSADVRHVPESGIFSIGWIPAKGESVQVDVTLHAALEGRHLLWKFSYDVGDVAASDALRVYSLNVASVIASAKADLANEIVPAVITVAVADRVAEFAIDRRLADAPAFMFANQFNRQEIFCLPASLESDFKTEVEEALIGSRLEPYDRSYSESFTVASEALDENEVRSVRALLSSHDVRWMHKIVNGVGTWLPVIVDEATLKNSSMPQSPFAASFKFHIANDRPLASLDDAERVFDIAHNPSFN